MFAFEQSEAQAFNNLEDDVAKLRRLQWDALRVSKLNTRLASP